MVKKILLLFFLYFLLLIQISFLAPFEIRFSRNFFGNNFFNLILIFLCLINFFERRESSFGIFSAFVGGFLVDIFSETFIGFHIFFFLLVSFAIKFFLKRYVQIFDQEKKLF